MAVLNDRTSHRFCALIIFLAALAAGAQSLADKDRLEAVYLVKFLRFIDWPPEALPPAQPIVIGVWGADAFARSLSEAAEGETANQHQIIIRHIHRGSEAANCQVLFLGASERSHLPSVLSAIKQHSILTISDGPEFCTSGGTIGFVIENNRLRFQINVAVARAANLTISSKLLELAEIVHAPAPD